MVEQVIPKANIHHINGYKDANHPALAAKLVPRDQLTELGDFWRNRHQRIAFTSGTYDMIHVGHVRYLELARSLGDILVVGLNSDESVRAYKGPTRPILGQERRAEMLAALSAVSYITLYDETTADELIKLLKPDAYLCVEGSWEDGTDLETKAEVRAMSLHGGDIYLAPRQEPGLSTSVIIEQLESNGRNEERARVRQLLLND